MVSSSQRLAADKKLKLPFGSWELDAEKAEIWPKCTAINVTGIESIGVYDDKYFVKIIEQHSELGEDAAYTLRLAALPKEICMMLLAGPDCTLQPIGRVFDKGFICGYIQPLGTTVTRNLPEVENFSHEEKLLVPPQLSPPPEVVIDALLELPSNLVSTKDKFHLLFCDFGSAELEGSQGAHISDTVQYISPFRALPANRASPATRADDIYATGITIWELHTGSSAFEGLDEDVVEDLVASGFQPNLYAISNPTTRLRVASCLEEGNCSLDSQLAYQPIQNCVVVTTSYANCASGRHTYEKVVHREGCSNGGDHCEGAYRAPGVLSHVLAETCHLCPHLSS